MLKFENLEIKIGEQTLFTTGEVILKSGIVALVGRNGSGKSTLIRTVLGNHDNYSGRIEINGHALHSFQKAELAKEIAIVYSRPDVFGNHSVEDILLLGRLPYQGMFGLYDDSDRLLVFRIAEVLNIQPLLSKAFQQLSDGEKQLVMIGRALVQDTPVLLMDEPSAFLDLVNRYRLMEIIREVVEESNKLIVFSTHDIDLLDKYCDHVLLINEEKMTVLSEIHAFESRIREAFQIE